MGQAPEEAVDPSRGWICAEGEMENVAASLDGFTGDLRASGTRVTGKRFLSEA